MDTYRWPLFATVGPYVLLAVLTGVMVSVQPTAVDLGLCGLLAVWMFVLFTVRPEWRSRPRVMAVFVIGLVVIMLVLTLRAPWFACFTPAAYVLAFRVLPWPWELWGVAGVAAVAGIAQASTIDRSSFDGYLFTAAVLAINIGPMCGFSWFMERANRQERLRRQTLHDLSEANARLAASLRENEDLQARLVAQAREAGVLDERQRMAREIHDTLAQGLTGIVTQLQAAEQAEDWRRNVTAAIDLARESLTEARRSVHALRPEALATARLSEALIEVANRWSGRHDIPVQVTTTGTPRPMSTEAEVALLRTAQEALANVAKHAHATRVGVTLSYLDKEVALDVRDDGVGIQDRPTDGGFGLVAMRQRIEGLAGTLQVESERGAGTAISAAVPVGGTP
ncbi:sensor histidine kinase [Kibdelosporangium lantanae]